MYYLTQYKFKREANSLFNKNTNLRILQKHLLNAIILIKKNNLTSI